MRVLFWIAIFLIAVESVLSEIKINFPLIDFTKPFGGIFDIVQFVPSTNNEGILALHNALTPKEADEDKIISILAFIDAQERSALSKRYERYYGRNLINDLKDKLTGNFEEAVIALMTPSHYYYVEEIHDSIRGIRSDESALIDILCLLNSSSVKVMSDVYKEYYGWSIEHDLGQYTVGNYKKLMSLCSRGMRNSGDMEIRIIRKDYDFDDETKDDQTINILATNSFKQIRGNVFNYAKLHGEVIEKKIMSRPSDDYRRAIAGIVQFAKSPPIYFAKRLHSVLEGNEVDHRGLIRLAIMEKSPSNEDIKSWYEKRYKNILDSVIASKTSGSYRNLLNVLFKKSPLMPAMTYNW